MNHTFNIQRFGLLLKRQWLEFGKIYLISLGVALGVLIAFYSIGLADVLFDEDQLLSHDLNFREPLFLCFGFIFISIIASTYFAHLGQKPKAIIDLLIPASTFEKFLSGIFFTAILSSASFLLLFYLTDWAFVSKLKSLLESGKTPYEGNKEEIMFFFSKYWEMAVTPVFVVPFFVTSIFLLGSVYFNKFHYIKTAISVMIFVGLWCLIIFNAGEGLFKDRIPMHMDRTDNFGKADEMLLITLLLSGLTLIFWAITYVRLKEKEV